MDIDDKIKEWSISLGLMVVGVLAGPSFGGEKNTKRQVVAQIAVGICVIIWLDSTHLSRTTIMGITMLYGFISKYFFRAIINAAKKFEGKLQKKLEKKADDATKFLD